MQKNADVCRRFSTFSGADIFPTVTQRAIVRFCERGNGNNLIACLFQIGQKPFQRVHGIGVAVVHKHDSARKLLFPNRRINIFFAYTRPIERVNGPIHYGCFDLFADGVVRSAERSAENMPRFSVYAGKNLVRFREFPNNFVRCELG